MFGFLRSKSSELLSSRRTLPGRPVGVEVPDRHFVTGRPIKPPFGDGIEVAQFCMGCFWGAERLFWQTPGVYSTAVGYAGGDTPNPSYEEVCSGLTNHAEAVLVAFDPSLISYVGLLKVFWEGHDPTQGMRQGNDVGTQYRSAIYAVDDAQLGQAHAAREAYQRALRAAGLGLITTEIKLAGNFYYAEAYHQQYLGKNPGGYCGLGGTGVGCSIGILAAR